MCGRSGLWKRWNEVVQQRSDLRTTLRATVVGDLRLSVYRVILEAAGNSSGPSRTSACERTFCACKLSAVGSDSEVRRRNRDFRSSPNNRHSCVRL